MGIEDLNCYVVDCESTILDVRRMLLASTPSFVQGTNCGGDCPPTTENLAFLPIKDTSVRATICVSAIVAELALEETSCLKLGCAGRKKYDVTVAGMLLLEIKNYKSYVTV